VLTPALDREEREEEEQTREARREGERHRTPPPRAPPHETRLELLAELCAVTAPVDVRRCGHRTRELVEDVAELLEFRLGMCRHVRSSPPSSRVLRARSGGAPAPSPRSTTAPPRSPASAAPPAPVKLLPRAAVARAGPRPPRPASTSAPA